MSTDRVAHRLVESCRAGEFLKALDELYAEGVVSIQMDVMKEICVYEVRDDKIVRERFFYG
jgi:hypothetical protein